MLRKDFAIMRGYCDYCEEFSENIENVWRDEIENWVDLCPECQDEETCSCGNLATRDANTYCSDCY